MAIEGSTIGKGNGSKTVEECEHKSIPDAQLEELVKDMEDEEGDKEAGCRTLPVEMGIDYSRTIVVILSIASIAALWIILFFVPQLRESYISWGYFFLFLTVPYLLLALKMIYAKTKKDFTIASGLSKLIMLMGILFILVARTFFV